MTKPLTRGPWLSPAKLNLFLYINGQRPDGYHQLQTLFQFLDHGDQLYFDCRNDGQLHLKSEIKGLADADNLIIKAAKLLQQYSQTPLGADIELTKVLPMGGGIGGGSSNAATTLLVLNKLWQTNLSNETLAKIGLQLGADVPIFVSGHAAFAEGVGEQLQTVDIDESWYLVLVPPVHVSTASVFQAKQLKRDTPVRTWDQLNNAEWTNDCQEFVSNLYPEVAQALMWLLEYAPSRMTGTGSCVFAQFSSKSQAQAVLEKCPMKYQAFIARSCNQSPLLAQLDSVF